MAFTYSKRQQWDNLELLHNRVADSIKSLGHENVKVNPIFKSFQDVTYNTLYLKWATGYDDLSMNVGKDLPCRVDGKDGKLNAQTYAISFF